MGTRASVGLCYWTLDMGTGHVLLSLEEHLQTAQKINYKFYPFINKKMSSAEPLIVHYSSERV